MCRARCWRRRVRAAYDREIRWRVQYERVAFPADDGDAAEVEASVTVAQGVLRPWE